MESIGVEGEEDLWIAILEEMSCDVAEIVLTLLPRFPIPSVSRVDLGSIVMGSIRRFVQSW